MTTGAIIASQNFLQIHPGDDVLIALKDLAAGSMVPYEKGDILLTENIPAKHKLFTHDISAGQPVRMYGSVVGTAVKNITKGSRMSVENTQHATEQYSYRQVKYQWQPPDISKFKNKTFKGYRRNDGRVGTANYWLFMPTVFCENRNLDVIREAMHNELGYAVTGDFKRYTHQLVEAYKNGGDVTNTELSASVHPSQKRLFKNIDGIKFLNHNGGCGGTRQDSATLGQLLAAYADHPNVAGVTILSLGCQHLQTGALVEDIKKRNPQFDKPVLVFEQQTSKSEKQLVQDAIRETFLQLVEANKQERTDAPLSELCVGVKCGGSDGFSGISANPAVGYCADMLVALGAKILLAEFPELCGAEQNLIDRCVDENTANKFIHLMQEYNEQAVSVGSGFHMNPSPGNIRDGLITDAIKSIGAALKGGTSPVVDVLDYSEPVRKPGLSLVCTPGNDVEATTGKAASGATLILFTTGLGTPTGNPVCPVIKIATNTALAKRMADIIDINTGDIIDGKKTIAESGEEILEYLLKVAGGETLPAAVRLNQDDFIPWRRGVSL